VSTDGRTLPWRVVGRVLTVVGYALLMATLTVVNVRDAGVLDDLMLGDVITVVSSAAFVLLAGGLETTGNDKGVIVRSPNGTRWRMGVSNAGAVTVVAA